ncbi:MAG: glycosyltransferase [Acutalibacter sp.]
MEKNILILATTNDFLLKFERDDVALLQSMGYTVHYAANLQEPHYLSDVQAIRQAGVIPHHIPIARSPYLLGDNSRALGQVLELLERWNIRAIHCHTPVGGLVGRLAGKFSPGNPVVVYTAHGFHFYRGAPLYNRLAFYPVEHSLARFTDILVTINDEDYRAARKLPLKRGGLVFRLPGVGLDRRVFSPLPPQRRAALRGELGIGPEEFFLLSVGELNLNKNHQVVLQALSLLKEWGALRGIRYGICGEGFSRPRLEQEIRDRGLEDVAALYGYRRDVESFLGSADATVFPSRREGLGMAGLESLAMGVPVIAADNRGTREYMAFGKNGLIYPWDDPAGFARGIALLRGLDAPRREALSRRCVASVAPFDRTLARDAMKAVYCEMDRKVRERNGTKTSCHRVDGLL